MDADTEMAHHVYFLSPPKLFTHYQLPGLFYKQITTYPGNDMQLV